MKGRSGSLRVAVIAVKTSGPDVDRVTTPSSSSLTVPEVTASASFPLPTESV